MRGPSDPRHAGAAPSGFPHLNLFTSTGEYLGSYLIDTGETELGRAWMTVEDDRIVVVEIQGYGRVVRSTLERPAAEGG